MSDDEIPTLDLVLAQREPILALAARYGVANVRVIGSVARGQATVGSDIDLLVDYESGTGRGGLRLFTFAAEVERLLGHPVDIGTVMAPSIAGQVAADAVRL